MPLNRQGRCQENAEISRITARAEILEVTGERARTRFDARHPTMKDQAQSNCLLKEVQDERYNCERWRHDRAGVVRSSYQQANARSAPSVGFADGARAFIPGRAAGSARLTVRHEYSPGMAG